LKLEEEPRPSKIKAARCGVRGGTHNRCRHRRLELFERHTGRGGLSRSAPPLVADTFAGRVNS